MCKCENCANFKEQVIKTCGNCKYAISLFYEPGVENKVKFCINDHWDLNNIADPGHIAEPATLIRCNYMKEIYNVPLSKHASVKIFYSFHRSACSEWKKKGVEDV